MSSDCCSNLISSSLAGTLIVGSPCHFGRVGISIACVMIAISDVVAKIDPSAGRFPFVSFINLPMSVGCMDDEFVAERIPRRYWYLLTRSAVSAMYSTQGI